MKRRWSLAAIAIAVCVAVAVAQAPSGGNGAPGAAGSAGAAGATGANGNTGATGPAPSGTGVLVNLTSATPTANTVFYRQTANVNAAATTTMMDLTGLSATLAAGTYKFKVLVFCTPTAAGGCRYQTAFSGTATSIAYYQQAGDANNSMIPQFNSAFSSVQLSNFAATDTQSYISEGTIVVSVSGVLKPQFSQDTASGTSTALAGGTLEIWPIP